MGRPLELSIKEAITQKYAVQTQSYSKSNGPESSNSRIEFAQELSGPKFEWIRI